jgi:hypothetical protein
MEITHVRAVGREGRRKSRSVGINIAVLGIETRVVISGVVPVCHA